MSDEEILKQWNMGLTREQVAKMYMQDNNRLAKLRTNVSKITKVQAMKHVEPILWKYRMQQLEEKII